MANIVREELEDGSVYEFDIDVCVEVAGDAMELLAEAHGEVEMFDFVTGVYALFAESVHILTSAGWTEQQLVNEIFDHSEQHRHRDAVEVEAGSEEDDDEEEETGTIKIKGTGTVH